MHVREDATSLKCVLVRLPVHFCVGGLGTHAAHVRQDDAELGLWTRNLRVMFKHKRLSLDQVSTLRKIGFCFDGYKHKETVVKTEGKTDDCSKERLY